MSVLDSMRPGMVYTLRLLDHDPATEVHGPMLARLMRLGMVRHTNRGLTITWAGQKALNEWRQK